MLSDTPLGPFESTDLKRLLNLVSIMKDQLNKPDAQPQFAVTVIARVQRLFNQYRFLNSYGQFDACLGGGRSVFSRKIATEEPVSWLLNEATVDWYYSESVGARHVLSFMKRALAYATSKPYTEYMSEKPEAMRQAANGAATDAITPNTTGAELTKPTGTSHELRNEPRESTGSYLGSRGENDDSRGPGAHCMHGQAGAPSKPQDEPQETADKGNARGVSQEVDRGDDSERVGDQTPKGRAGEKVAAAKGPGESEQPTRHDHERNSNTPEHAARGGVRRSEAHEWRTHQPTARRDCTQRRTQPHDDVPEPCTPPTRHLKRPIESANPPRRCERLKLRPTRVHRARAYEEMRTRSRWDHPRQIGSDRMHRISTRDAGGAS
ncbi:hypothetical protein BU15DRAFT_68404 [Melanogaster broomeanus]|nr:hypothetical protein BU15DRAFT_68404 [Melanogaster broomeanus]